MNRAEQIFDAFAKFHERNPIVWQLFEQFTMEIVGRPRGSAQAVFERIRWQMDIETQGSELKLNNNFCAYYARMFEAKHPEFTGFFRSRKRISEDKPAWEVDIQEWHLPQPSDELILMLKLKAMAH